MKLSLMVMNAMMTILKHQEPFRWRVDAVHKTEHVLVLNLHIFVSMNNQDRAWNAQLCAIQLQRVHDAPADIVVSSAHGLHFSECAGILREAFPRRRSAAIVTAGHDSVVVGRNVHSYC